VRRSKELFREVAPDYRADNDPWGHAMGAAFDVCAELTNRDLAVPAAWRYRPSPIRGPQEVSDYVAEAFADLAITDAELLRLGDFLHRLTGRLNRAGRSY
jgi:hypothetical protein